MMTLFFLASLVVFGYAIFVKGRFDVTSISESYYKLSEINPNLGYLFTAWCVAPTFLLFPIWVERMPEQWQFLAFLSVVFLGAVGCAPRYLTNQKVAHYVFTALALTLSVSACVILGEWYIPIALLIATAIATIITKRRDALYWLELAAFAGIFVVVSYLL